MKKNKKSVIKKIKEDIFLYFIYYFIFDFKIWSFIIY